MNVDFRAFRTTALINDGPIATCPLISKRITSNDAVFPGTVNLHATGTIINCPDPINPTDVANLRTAQSASQNILDGYFPNKGDLLVGTEVARATIEPATFSVGADDSQLTADSTNSAGVAWRPNPVTVAGDIYTHNATTAVALPISVPGSVLTATTSDASDTKLTWTIPIERQMIHPGDLAVGVAASEAIVLPVGADDSQLTADSTQPMGVAWRPNPVTAAGDIYTHNATSAVALPISGTVGTVLTAVSSGTSDTKLAWTVPPTTLPSPGYSINLGAGWGVHPDVVPIAASPTNGWFTIAGAVNHQIAIPGTRSTLDIVFPSPVEGGPTIFYPTISTFTDSTDIDNYGISVNLEPAGFVRGDGATHGRMRLSYASNAECPPGRGVKIIVVVTYSINPINPPD